MLHELSYRPHIEKIWGWDDDQQAEFFERFFQPAQLQIVEVGGEAVGVLEVEERDDELFLANIDIRPEWQSRGIGSSIVRSLQERARDAGKPLALQVLHVNARARALYERLGFVETWRNDIRSGMRWPIGDVPSTR